MLLVTGATGYVGSAVVAELVRRGHRVRAATRRSGVVVPAGAEPVHLDLDDEASWRPALDGCDAVVHCGVVGRPGSEETAHANTALVARLLAVTGDLAFVYTSTTAAVLTPDGVASERAPATTALDDVYLRHKTGSERLVL